MSDNKLKVNTTVGDDWNWDQIQDVWERISSVHDHFKRTGAELPWAARGSLFAAMQLFLLEAGGDVNLARATMADLLQLCSTYVAGQVLTAMQLAWESQELEGQKLSPKERATLKSNIDTLSTEIESSRISALSPEQLQHVLEAQDVLAQAVHQVHEENGPEVTLQALAAILQQAMLFASQGDIDEAKAGIFNLLHQMWPVAVHNVQNLVQETNNELKNGPAETRPN